ncbi:hypothetical protein, partial [Vibrio vulnificus]|uniref:hypothetical protein n=1 Tax=Vibrio vulnificus TaxID=672 RepID=UPI001E638FE0
SSSEPSKPPKSSSEPSKPPKSSSEPSKPPKSSSEFKNVSVDVLLTGLDSGLSKPKPKLSKNAMKRRRKKNR